MTYLIHDTAELAEDWNAFCAETMEQAVYFIGDTERDTSDFTCTLIDMLEGRGVAQDVTEEWARRVDDYRDALDREGRLTAEHERIEGASWRYV